MAEAPLVLIVDDDESVRGVVSELVAELGYEVVCAEDGEAALARLSGLRKPTLVLLDLVMPVMNGWEVLAAVQNRVDLEDVPFVVFTASGARITDANPHGRVASVEGRPVLHKPIDPDLLVDMVRSFCETAREVEATPSDLLPRFD